MSIALFAISDLISPLAGLARWLLPNTQKSPLLARTFSPPKGQLKRGKQP